MQLSDRNTEKMHKILDAATDIFLSHGFSASTTDMIQKKAGISKATLYACFANKETLFEAVIERKCSQMHQFVSSVDATSHSIEETLQAMGMIYLRFILSAEGLAVYRVCISEATRFPALSHMFYLAGPLKMAKVVMQYLEYAAEQKQINLQRHGLEASAHIFLSLMRGDIHVEYLTHPDAQASEALIEKRVKTAVQLFLNSIADTTNHGQ
ncbi:TetR family transcriptional regulator [Acinetobacter calcoaceticus]|uniref:TetR family transcriptional regulator n=1 Tax=Acinetobacter calcoaceticus TaxID=471 RepID=A0A4R1Y4L8_ACICA|nr:TetR family transcriptional regulator [Acinetobacter calcoaceticus]